MMVDTIGMQFLDESDAAIAAGQTSPKTVSKKTTIRRMMAGSDCMRRLM